MGKRRKDLFLGGFNEVEMLRIGALKVEERRVGENSLNGDKGLILHGL